MSSLRSSFSITLYELVIFAERGFDRDDYSAEDDLCKGVRRMSTTPQKAPEPRAPFRHYSYRDADERPPAWQRKSAF